MKRIISFAAVLAMVFGSAACQKEVLTQKKGDSMVTFSVAIPVSESVTKAEMSDGSTADVLYYQAYVGDDRMHEGELRKSTVNAEGFKQFELTLNLVKNETYDILFWAQNSTVNYYSTDDLREVTVNYDGLANDEKRDAFFGSCLDFTPEGIATNKTVNLTRPFAQINFATSEEDWRNAESFVMTDKGLESQVTFTSLPTKFNVMTGDIVNDPSTWTGEVTMKYAQSPATEKDYANDYISYKGNDYAWVAMNYVLASKTEDSINSVKGEFVHAKNNAATALSSTVWNVPFKQNYKTNILGEFFTGGNKFIIQIVPSFVDEDNDGQSEDYILTTPLRYAFENGGQYTLDKDLKLSSPLEVSGNDVTLDLNGHTLEFENGSDAFYITSGTLTIKDSSEGNGTVKTQDKTAGYGVFVNGEGAVAKIEGGHFIIGVDDISKMDQTYAGNSAVYTKNGGKAYISGGKFEVQTTQTVDDVNLTRFLINKNGTAATEGGDIEISGGTFVKFDPSNNLADGAGTDYVVEGYKVEIEGDNYTVVEE